MSSNVIIEPMTENFILWRCLHHGPLSKENINEWPTEQTKFYETRRAINLPLLKKIIKVYGTCALLARVGEQIVGTLRFYPKVLYTMPGAGSSLCLLRAFPEGVSARLGKNHFPPLDELEDRTLKVHCWTIAPSFKEKNPFRPEGFRTHMVQELIRWARDNKWQGIETAAYEDTDVLHTQMGMPGRHFWETLGFCAVKTETETAAWFIKFLDTMQKEMIQCT